ncbi:uncharacterized protein EAF01_000514 [Botrytis porri]|uniref:uncharacterized protein n=1 Tax=Botrytis porri TaxID=87229 RepID=UPI00190285AF|nr:uncharacterized protein EAF01_000514 [Botrytis porri]KAF7914108.1 hypothetical protein EAF01_000514 [Botrytis porri]
MERGRERSVRGSERGGDRRRDDYSDTETVKRSQNYKSHDTTSRKPKGSSGRRAKYFDNRGGPPLSKSAGLGFANAFAPPSVAPSTAKISPENHKSISVVADEVYERDRLNNRDDNTILSAAAERGRRDMARKQGSLSEKERYNRVLNYGISAGDNVMAGPAPSEAPSIKTYTSGATRDTGYTRDTRVTENTRESRPRTRAGSVEPSSRGSQNTRLRSGSTAALDRTPVQRGTSFHMSSSTTIVMTGGNNGAAYQSQRHHQSLHMSSGDGRRKSEIAQAASFVPRSGNIADSEYRSSRGGKRPDIIVDYAKAGIQSFRPGNDIGGNPARHRPLPILPSESRSHSRIEDLKSVAPASDASESTVKPLRRSKAPAGGWPFENSQSGAKTMSPSEASMLEKPAASRSGRTERSGRPGDLRSMYSKSEARPPEASVAASNRTRSSLGLPPSLNGYGGPRAPSTTASHRNRLASDGDLAIERDRYRREEY